MPKCTDCDNPAIARFTYTQTDWCAQCFQRVFRNRVARAIREQGGFKHGERVAVAISGGKDSAALLHSLHLKTKGKKVDLVPVLIDEGIDGYRGKAITKARAVCDSLRLPLHVFSCREFFGASMDEVMASQNREEGACSYCGVFRKAALNKAALLLRCGKLATGHNADDAAQTLLLNLLRGEVQRLAQWDHVSRSEKMVPRVRPLFYVPERETALYCELNGLPYHCAECPYSSEGLRQDVKHFLNAQESKYPGTKFRLLNSFMEIKEKLSTKGTATRLSYCRECGAPASSGVCRACEMLAGLEA